MRRLGRGMGERGTETGMQKSRDTGAWAEGGRDTKAERRRSPEMERRSRERERPRDGERERLRVRARVRDTRDSRQTDTKDPSFRIPLPPT